ncbi:MAG: hypothetical protein ACLR09_05265 [Gallintestinimicrobium sp.]
MAEQASAAQASQAASEPAPTAPVLPERMSEFVQEELKTLQGIIRQDARSRKYQTVGGKHLLMEPASGTRATTVRELLCLQTFIRFCPATGCRKRKS